MPAPLSLLILLILLATGCAPAGRGPLAAPGSVSDGTIAGREPLAGEDEEVVSSRTGTASYYARRFEGRSTASGAMYDAGQLTAAHRTLPFGTRVRVTNLANGESVVVTITDRGPFSRGRIIDLSRQAARELGFLADGTTRVRIDVLR